MKNNNLKEKTKGLTVKNNPFQKVDPNQPVPISEVVGKAIGNIPVNNEEPVATTITAREMSNTENEKKNKIPKDLNAPKAYIAGKDYFDQLKNNIKDCDPDIDIDLYTISINSVPGKEDIERIFRITLSTKCDNEAICNFDVKNEKDSWADIINNLSKDIVGIIKKYQSGDLDSKSEGELLQKSMKERFGKITSNLKNNKPEEKTEVFYPVVIDTTTGKITSNLKNNKPEEKTEVFYPVVIDTTTKKEDCPELEKVRAELFEEDEASKIIDIVIEDEKVEVIDFGLTELEKRSIIDSIPSTDYPYLTLYRIDKNIIRNSEKILKSVRDIFNNIIPQCLKNNEKLNSIQLNDDSEKKVMIENIVMINNYFKDKSINYNDKVFSDILTKVLPKLI